MTFTVSASETSKACGAMLPGCAVHGGSVAWARSAAFTHELAHLALFQVQPAPDAFLDEGFAVAAANPETTFRWSPAYGDFVQSVAATQSSEVSYATAGDFVAYIYETYGVAAFADLLRVVPSGASSDSFAAAFEAIDGVPLSQAASDRQALPYDFSATRLADPVCNLPVGNATRSSVSLTFECSNPRVVGLRSEQSRLVTETVSIPSDGVYMVKVGGEGAVVTLPVDDLLSPCAPVAPRTRSDFGDLSAAEVSAVFAAMRAGPHAIRAVGDAGERLDLAWQLVDATSPPSLGTDTTHVALIGIPGEVATATFRIDATIHATHFVVNATSPSLCSETAGSPACVDLSSTSGFDVELLPGVYSLSYGAAPGPTIARVELFLHP